MKNNPSPTFEFHVARDARDFYQFDQSIYSLSGNVIFPNFHAARVFSQKMNDRRDLAHFPERAVKASQINAMGLIDELLHIMFAQYRAQVNPNVLAETLASLQKQLGAEQLEQTLRAFGDQFPPLTVYRRQQTLDEYLGGESEALPHREITLEELLMLWLSNENPAFTPYRELFDDSNLEKHSAYRQVIQGIDSFFDDQPGLSGARGESFLDMLRAPAKASPHSLAGQLEYIRQNWGGLLGTDVYRLLSSLDFVSEEEKAIFWGPGPVQVADFSTLEFEPEQYSMDLDWMPRVVMLAKNTYVWLDQLSKQYDLPITTLDQVPDEELDRMASLGITTVWLIGLWERSKASQRIKQMMGNPEAVASAYSLYDYRISADLGGEEAMDDLRQRAWRRGMRIASDMVPNHMAVDSRWVLQHPDWFLSLDHSPYPGYSFNGVNLSSDDRVGVYLEDHYYDRTDAAVVFKRIDHWTGDTRYIYHGNDGTTMPWNDTAQLDYLKPEVREAVIQTILHVARQFPVIRFDAAMTLAKRHVQRLWYPEPGSGGAIPSRAEHGMTKGAFDAAMPVEFWREVVDRVAEEAPNTLLLAEAFWLMEGYFVRTLGMHRVYNSAFMHMMRDEDNAKYRNQIKSTLDFDPEILKRYVNFMSNPDEETAMEQFGKGDKYFGICTVMVTVPGLPMFGHGQFEGFGEKYGMEYRRAYWDEQPDGWLVRRHEREITPLLRRRYLFAEVANFRLYDFVTADGSVDENVLAYSNRSGDERSLVVYHNKWGDTRGWLRTSVAYLDKGSGEMRQDSLATGMNLNSDPALYLVMSDAAHGLEYLRHSRTLVDEGMYIELGAYQRHVFLDIREVYDENGAYAALDRSLRGRGVPSIQEAMTELVMQPMLQAYRKLINAETFTALLAAVAGDEPALETLMSALEAEERALWTEILAQLAEPDEPELAEESLAAETGDARMEAMATRRRQELAAILSLPDHLAELPFAPEAEDRAAWGGLFAWSFTHDLGQLAGQPDAAALTRSWMDEWLLGRQIEHALGAFGLDAEIARRISALAKILVSRQDLLLPADTDLAPNAGQPELLLHRLLNDSDVQNFLQVNRYGGVLWYNQEAFADLMQGLFLTGIVTNAVAEPDMADDELRAQIARLVAMYDEFMAADAQSGYQVEKLLSYWGDSDSEREPETGNLD
ncbi:MAG: hypothetical protein J5I90_13080 [Caldilineales bacterium]|nr:hypothetical protein [Caldilineales bacterium]